MNDSYSVSLFWSARVLGVTLAYWVTALVASYLAVIASALILYDRAARAHGRACDARNELRVVLRDVLGATVIIAQDTADSTNLRQHAQERAKRASLYYAVQLRREDC